MSQSKKGKPKPNDFNKLLYKPVLQFDKQDNFISKYESLKEAKHKTNVDISNISSCYNGKKKYAGDFKWRFPISEVLNKNFLIKFTMLKELLNNLQTLKNEADTINQLPEDQRVAVVTALAEKILNMLDNANIELPIEYSDISGIEVPTSEL